MLGGGDETVTRGYREGKKLYLNTPEIKPERIKIFYSNRTFFERSNYF